MDEATRADLAAVHGQDRQGRYTAYLRLMAATDEPVAWAYEVWDDLLADLGHADNHVRAIAAQLLCNLAGSDPEQRMLRDLPALLRAARDVRFVTARHSLQALWKVGLAGEAQRRMLVDGLARRFEECQLEKNCTLVRADILVGLHRLYAAVGDEGLREKALALIETESDLKARKKYARLW